MSKRKIVFALLLIASTSLLNIVVLIEASNQENQLTVDPLKQQSLQSRSEYELHYNKLCNYASWRCDIDQDGNNCYQYRYDCEDQSEDP